MRNFWWQLRLVWLWYILKHSILWGAAISGVITLTTVLYSGTIRLDTDFFVAVWDIAAFWFRIAWVLVFLLSTIGALKALFMHDYADVSIQLLNCKDEPLAPVILADVMHLWRKFLFFTVWLVVLTVLVGVGVFGFSLSLFGGTAMFLMVLGFGMMMLKPLLLTTKNVSIRPKGKR